VVSTLTGGGDSEIEADNTLMQNMRRKTAREIECAIGSAVTRAVADRRAVLEESGISSDTFEDAIAARMRAKFLGGQAVSVAASAEFVIPAYRASDSDDMEVPQLSSRAERSLLFGDERPGAGPGKVARTTLELALGQNWSNDPRERNAFMDMLTGAMRRVVKDERAARRLERAYNEFSRKQPLKAKIFMMRSG
jgi:hypothetical protein